MLSVLINLDWNLMSEANKALVQRWFDEVWNKGRADAINAMLDENGIVHDLSDDPATPIMGPRTSDLHTLFREAFQNMMIVVEDTIADYDRVATRCSVRATHEGDFLGITATESPVDLRALQLSGSTTENSTRRGTTSTS